MMNKIEFMVEKTKDGFSAYAVDDQLPIATSGDSLSELKTNILDAYNSYAEFKKIKEIEKDDVSILLDIPQFFEFYKVINASALGAKIGMDKTLISQYVNGHKKPGPKQVQKILDGIRALGSELAALDFSMA